MSYLVEKIRDGQAIPKVSSERRWVCYDVTGSTMNDFAWENETAEQVKSVSSKSLRTIITNITYAKYASIG